MDFTLSKQHEMARTLFKEFAEKEVKPLAQEVDETEVFPRGTVEKMAKAYGMEPDKLKEYMGDAEKESMKKDIAITKAVDLIMDNIKERAKAKRKTDAAKEESAEE